MERTCFTISTQTYRASCQANIDQPCNAWTAINIGDDVVQIENIILLPGAAPALSGQSVSVGGNENEVLVGKQLNVKFAGVGVNPAVQIIQKTFAK